MSQENSDARHPQCKLLADGVPEGCPVISAEGSRTRVPLQKRKEAEQTLYLDRV